MAFTIKVNGVDCTADVDGDTPLLWVLRDVFGMTGTKFGCGMALCGPCTVHLDGTPTRSCITTIDSVGRAAVITIEPIGDTAAGQRIPVLTRSRSRSVLLGPLQFVARLRTTCPRVHRWAGRVYVMACVIGGWALWPPHRTPLVAGFRFGILATLWIGATLAAWQAAVQRNLPLHRLLMRFSYAMTFSAVTLRLQITLGFAPGWPSYSAMSV
jgi:hypothetical protein